MSKATDVMEKVRRYGFSADYIAKDLVRQMRANKDTAIPWSAIVQVATANRVNKSELRSRIISAGGSIDQNS